MDPVSLVAAALGAGLSAGLALVGATVAATAALRPPPGATRLEVHLCERSAEEVIGQPV